ncbi:hypothetical protein [Halobellus rubicundus]|uniref:Uncharacterized protein n=1 Tax=Halobellus rubicundus TaxID=2996466 RepID=A0ABD5MEN8_9EURY
MHAALLYAFPEPDTVDEPDELPSNFEGLPAADIDATQYLDGRRIFDGALADEIEVEADVAVVGEDFITEERDQQPRRIKTDVYLDPHAGWVGCDSSDGEELLINYAQATLGQRPEPAVLDLEGFAERHADELDTQGIVYSQSVDEGHHRDAAGAHWHEDASTDRIPTEGTAMLSVSYMWDGIHVDGALAASGYLAIYKDWTTATFARWVAEEITPHLAIEREEEIQKELTSGDACADCGRESDDLEPLEAAPIEGPLCPVCRDKHDEAADESGGEAA